MAIISNKPSHLRALLKKNWILWKRSWCVSLCEILIPLIFALMLASVRSMDPTQDIPTVEYYQKASTTFTFDGTLNPSYFKDCNADENGGMVAIVPESSTDSLADDIDQALSKIEIYLRRSSNIEKIEAAGFKTKVFASNEAIDDYTSLSNYAAFSAKKETLCFAVVINKNGANNQYEYMLRFNVSGFDDPDLPDTSNRRVDIIGL